MSGQIIDFAVYRIARSGSGKDSDWSLPLAGVPRVEVCVYLMDTENQAALVFGCSSAAFKDVEALPWHHFIGAWDVLADPGMAFDEIHKHHTIELAIRALPGCAVWDGNWAIPGDATRHLLVAIDRSNAREPARVFAINSAVAMLSAEEIRSMLDGDWTGDGA